MLALSNRCSSEEQRKEYQHARDSRRKILRAAEFFLLIVCQLIDFSEGWVLGDFNRTTFVDFYSKDKEKHFSTEVEEQLMPIKTVLIVNFCIMSSGNENLPNNFGRMPADSQSSLSSVVSDRWSKIGTCFMELQPFM